MELLNLPRSYFFITHPDKNINDNLGPLSRADYRGVSRPSGTPLKRGMAIPARIKINVNYIGYRNLFIS
jgi:hypothetical protein